MIPEPSLLNLDDYEPNIAAMTEHYTELFEGKTHREVVAMLEDKEINYSFLEPDTIRFWVVKEFVPVFAAYSMRIRVAITDGMFAGVKDVGAGGLDAL